MSSEYFDLPLDLLELQPDPVAQFTQWYQQAIAKGELEPSAMSFATVNKNYDVSARMLLLKSFDQQGFVFYTNYLSPKAQYIKEVPKGAMVFWWPLCQRQVRITGNIVLVGEQKSDAYFQQRSKSSRIAAIVSKQSATIPDRDYLLKQFQALSKDYADATNIPRPDYWGGYVLEHQSIEFWQGRSHRLHDRFLYTREAKGWKIEQLSP